MSKPTGKPNGRPVGTKKLSSKQLADLLVAYMQQQATAGKLITMTGFQVFADISHETMRRYEQSPAYGVTIKKLRLNAENALIDKLLNENKPIGPIFMLKANYGYIEQQKLDLTSNGETLGVVQLPTRASK